MRLKTGTIRGFLGGAEGKNLPVSEGDLEGSHAVKQLSPCTTTAELMLLGSWAAAAEPVCHNYWSPHALEPVTTTRKATTKRSRCCYCCWVASVVSDSVRSHRRQPTRLPRPWDSPGKNTGVGCHFLLQCRKVKSESEVARSCPTLRDPMDCSLPGSSIHGIFQARVLEWGAIAFSREAAGVPQQRVAPSHYWGYFLIE